VTLNFCIFILFVGSEATEWADDAQTSYYTRCAESRWEGKLEGDDEDDDDDGPAADEHEETKTSNNVKTHEMVGRCLNKL